MPKMMQLYSITTVNQSQLIKNLNKVKKKIKRK